MTDERYTLDEARAELARRECASIGHNYEHVEQDGEPLRMWCARCGRTWTLQPE